MQRRKSAPIPWGSKILTGLIVGSIGTYVGLKHFPTARMRELTKTVQHYLNHPEKLGISKDVAEAIKKGTNKLSRMATRIPHMLGPQQSVSKILESTSMSDPDVVEALRKIRNTLVDRPNAFADVREIKRALSARNRPFSLLERITGARRLQLGDLFSTQGEWNKVFGAEPSAWSGEKGLISTVRSMMESDLPRGLKKGILNLPVDHGVFLHEGKIGDFRRLMPSTWMQSLDVAASKGNTAAKMARWALGLMAPTGAMFPSPSVAYVRKGYVEPYVKRAYSTATDYVSKHLEGGLSIQGTLFPLFRGPGVGKPVAKNLILARGKTPLTRALTAATRRPGALDDWLKERKPTLRKWGWLGKQAERSLRLLDKIGFGPQYASSIPGDPDNLFKSLINKGAVGTAQERYTWLAQKLSGKAASGAAGYVPMTRLGVANQFLNQQLHRVSWLLESTAGIGMKPSQHFAGTLGKWVALGGAAYAGYKYAGYTNYLGRKYTGVGPLDLPVHGYMAARQSLQGAVQIMGGVKAANYLEETFPGSVKSPGSRVMQGLGAAALARKFGAPGAVIAAVGATAFGTDLTMSAKQLGKIYRAEEEVPVRRSRFWMLGCLHPDQEVLLADGSIKPALDVRIGDTLVDKNGGSVRVLATQARDTDPTTEQLITIRIKGFPLPTRVTGNHEVLVHRNECPYTQYISGCHPKRKSGVLCQKHISGPNTKCTYSEDLNLVWVRADELRRSDYVVLPRRRVPDSGVVLDLRDTTVPYVEDGGGNVKCAQRNRAGNLQPAPRCDWVPAQLDTDERLGELLGWIFAEGSVHSPGRSIECVYHVDEADWAHRMAAHARALFGVRAAHSNRGGNTGRTVLSGRFLAASCSLLRIVPEKHISVAHLLTFGREFVAGFLRGAFYGDGCKGPRGWSFKTKSLESALAIRDLLVAVGSAARINRSDSKLNGRQFTAWVVVLTDTLDAELCKYYTEEKPEGGQTNHSWIGFDDYVLTPIQHIDVGPPPEQVYDFHVSGAESFCLPGHVVHNSSPFFGGPVEYYRPHMLAMALTDYKKEDIYGGPTNYYRYGTMLPTPTNLFGLKPLLDPYFVEQRNYWRRPYPLTSTFGSEIPLVGPMVESTLGRLIKPQKRMHQAYWHGDTLIEPGRFSANLGRPGPGRTNDPNARGGQATGPLELDQTVGKQIDIMRDFTGLPGFILGAIKSKITGSSDFFAGRRQIAHAGDITSVERGYYDMRFGGLFGMTELFRRFLPRTRNRQAEFVNPIVNDMPSWLPGSYSAFPADRQYHQDFHRGDPYGKVPHGEARLPGPGYETIHRLHSGVPGVYDAFDRYRILANVAPYSEAFKHYETIVMAQLRTSGVARESQGKSLEAYYGSGLRGLVTRVIDGDTMEVDIGGRLTTIRMAGVNTPESESDRRRENTLEGQMASAWTKKQFLGKRVRLNPVDIDHYGRLVADVERQGFIGQGPGEILKKAYPASSLTDEDRSEYFSIQHQIREKSERHRFYERIFADPFAVVPRNARKVHTMTLEKYNEQALVAGQYTLPEKFAGWAYENMAHFEPPGPLRWFKDKWFPIRSAVEHYERHRVVGTGYTRWETPLESFVVPWARSIADFAHAGTPMIPSHVRKRWEVESQFDRLKYLKSKSLSTNARLAGQQDLANYWADQQKRTATYALATGNLRYVRSSMNRLDRPYYNAFTRVHTEEERDRIRSMTSPDMRALLELSWSGVRPQGDPDADAAAYFGGIQQPGHDWAGWAPDVPLDLAKVKVAEQHGLDYHDLGLVDDQARQAEVIFDDWEPLETPDIGKSAHIRAHLYRLLRKSGYSDVSVDISERPSYGNSSSITLNHYRSPMYNIDRFLGYTMEGVGMRW